MTILHAIGIPGFILAVINIDFNTWQGWVLFIISTVYATAIVIIYGIRGYQAIRRENQAHEIRKKKYNL